jgi:hypothetical protein
MSRQLKTVFLILMTTALGFGFLHQFFGSVSLNFDRLHIFLFNLCSGGTLVLYYTENLRRLSMRSRFFLGISLIYAVLAFLELYPAAVACSLVLCTIVESVRIKRFSFFPWNFFDGKSPVSEKFNQASLLCLSMGLLISSAVIINNEYLKLITIPKLKLDTFFLGFSFPLSLITMSVMFAIMKPDKKSIGIFIRNLCFWTVNLGVIIFFLFILMEKLVPQVVVTSMLFAAVVTILYLFLNNVELIQQKNFLTSGMFFLLYTAITGIAYIIIEFFPETYEHSSKLLLKLHSFASLYGWNLSGLAVIIRYEDFPIRLHSRHLVYAHWIIVAFLAPMGYYIGIFSILAVSSYFLLLYVLFFTRAKNLAVHQAPIQGKNI